MTASDCKFFASAPTRDQAKRIYWEDLKKLTRPFWKGQPSETELVITLLTNSRLHVIGMDKPERIEGTLWHGGVLDEYANMKPNTFAEHVEAVTIDTGAWIDFVGVPDYAGRNAKEYKEIFDSAMLGAQPDKWQAFTWKSADVIDPAILAAIRQRVSPAAYRQEYEASWESAPGRAYNEFAKGLDVAHSPIELIPNVPLRVCCDFNYTHHVWSIVQALPVVGIGQRRYYVVEEIYLQSATVEAMCAALRTKLPEWAKGQGMLQFYGDYAGNQHRAEATHTAWQRIQQQFPDAGFNYVVNPPISDRVHAVNGVLCNAAGERSTLISPVCRRMIEDFEYVTLAMLYSQSKGEELTHASDGFGYFIHYYDGKAGVSVGDILSAQRYI